MAATLPQRPQLGRIVDKTQIRREVRAKRLGLSVDDVKKMSQKIVNRLVDYIDWKGIKFLHTYITIVSFKEVDTEPLIKYLKTSYPTIEVYAPIGKDENRHYLITPKGKEEVDPPEQIDLFIVPLVAFDDRGYRVGNGGGYYDRFLKLYPNAQKIGLAFELQKIDKIPAEPHDVPLDAVITESKAYNFK